MYIVAFFFKHADLEDLAHQGGSVSIGRNITGVMLGAMLGMNVSTLFIITDNRYYLGMVRVNISTQTNSRWLKIHIIDLTCRLGRKYTFDIIKYSLNFNY